MPGAWSRFVLAHLRWILAVTLAAVAAAAGFAFAQTPTYKATSVVVVQQPAAAVASGQQPNVATETSVVSSGVVLDRAAAALHVPVTMLSHGLGVAVPASTSLLQISYTDASPQVAQQRSRAITAAYLAYRSAGHAAHARAGQPGSPTAALITAAPLPASPSSPDIPIDLGAALIVGLALGLASAGLRDHLDDRLRGPADLEAQSGAPVLGLIPAFRAPGGDEAGRLAVVTAPDSTAAEAFRGLRTRVIAAADARGARTLLISSPGWEDKSTVAANLAAALAQSGRRTVLIDADLRWGRVRQLFGQPDSPGLAGVLEGRVPLETALRPGGVPGLRVLPAGALPADPAALLQQPGWRSVLGEVRRQADVVVIDGPPLLATPDAGPLAEQAEMVLLVADDRRSARAAVRVTTHEADAVRDRLLGWVLDDAGRRATLPRVRPAAASPDRAPEEAPGHFPAASNGHPVPDEMTLTGRAAGSPPAGQ
jgi:polysaccharide biosynthesis transport protein